LNETKKAGMDSVYALQTTVICTINCNNKSKQETPADAEIARHASRWMLSRCKTPYFSITHWSSSVKFGTQDRFGVQITKTPTYPAMCPNSIFLLHYVIKQSINVADGHTDGHHARSISRTDMLCCIAASCANRTGNCVYIDHVGRLYAIERLQAVASPGSEGRGGQELGVWS